MEPLRTCDVVEVPTVSLWCSARAALLDGLMKVGLRNRERRQFYAMNILLETKGSDLTVLKARTVVVTLAALCLATATCPQQMSSARSYRRWCSL